MACEEKNNVGVNNPDKIIIIMRIVKLAAHKREAFSFFPLSMCVNLFPHLGSYRKLSQSANTYRFMHFICLFFKFICRYCFIKSLSECGNSEKIM